MALTWTQHSTTTGYQVIKASLNGGAAGTAIIVKNDGSILSSIANESSFTGLDQQYLSANTLYVSIPDTVVDYATYFVDNPYKMTYQRNTPVIENITHLVEGDLSIQGDAQIEVGSGFSYTTDEEGNRTYTLTPANQRYAETCNLTEVKTTFDKSLKSSFHSVVAKQSDIATDTSILKRQMLDVLIRLDAVENGGA